MSLASAPPSGAKYESVPVGTVQEEAKEMTEYPLTNGFFDLGAVHLVATGTLECQQERVHVENPHSGGPLSY